MKNMTEEEANRLDEFYTITTPEIDPNRKGLLTRYRETPIYDDEATAQYINTSNSDKMYSN